MKNVEKSSSNDLTGKNEVHDTLLQKLFDNTPFGIYLVDSDFRIRAVNSIARSVFGNMPDLVGRDFAETIHILWSKESADEVVNQFHHTLETGEPYFLLEGIEERLDRKVTESYEWHISRIELSPGNYGVVCYFRDISASVADRRAIAESKTQLVELHRQIEQQAIIFNTTLSTITDYVYRLDRNGRFIYANQALLDLWGIEKLDESGISMPDLNYPKEVEAKVLEGVRRVFETRKTVKDQTAYTSPTGASEYHEFIFNPVFAEDGSVDFIIGSSRDISEHKKLEAELKEADRRKDEFLATLAHELRNPLAPIRSGLEILSQVRNDKEKAAQTLEILQRQTNQIVHLVDDLLDISRITQGKIKLRREHIDLKTAVSMAVETSQEAIDKARNELTITLPFKPIYIDADITRVAQILLNILNNAAKYSQPGGQISLNANKEGENAVIRIKDTGIGIEPDMIPKIFDIFGQIPNSNGQATGGLGIGLSVVKKLVEMHDGTFQALSEGIGKGCEFIVTFPLAVEKSATKPAQKVSEADILQTAQMEMPEEDDPGEDLRKTTDTRKVLVVDDNRDAAEMLETLLSIKGFTIHTAPDGKQAISIAKEFQPEICLLDIGLPGMNGYELAGYLRKIIPEALLISISGWGQEEDRRRSAEAGIDYHLVKPVQFEELFKLITKKA